MVSRIPYKQPQINFFSPENQVSPDSVENSDDRDISRDSSDEFCDPGDTSGGSGLVALKTPLFYKWLQ